MRKLYSLAIFVSFLMTVFFATNTSAVSQNVLISQIKVGNSATSRLVEVYNNSDTPVDITGWCLEYSSPSNTLPYTNLGCFSDPNPAVHIFIDDRSYALSASSQTGLLTPDIFLTAGLGLGTSGHVYLIDNTGVEIDRVGWGEAVNAEGNNPIVLDSTKVIERRQDSTTGVLVDTDNNGNDFMNSSLRQTYQYGSLYDKTDLCNNVDGIQEIFPDGFTDNGSGGCSPPPHDFCPNLDEIQPIIPNGYGLDNSGNCVVDICLNIVGLQQVTPENMDLDGQGNCLPRDLCINLSGIQAVIPNGYSVINSNICKIILLPLKITELLPNAVGGDEGNEFIEIFNPNNIDIDLTNYYLVISGVGRPFNFPFGSHIAAGEYLAFSNDDIKFTLLNTTNTVQITSKTGDLFDETPAYVNPKEGFSWAIIDNVWQYTNQLTPNAVNLLSVIEVTAVIADAQVVVESDLKPCATNQYRSPETNRCRQMSTSDSILSPCKDGQYRSEETNRCRNITSDVSELTQCAEGQERNPETNRCRTVALLGTNELTPCKEGQERNPDTNRCRNVVSDMPKADYAPKQSSQAENNYVLWWSIAGVGLVAIVYGVWEWRQEIGRLIQKIIGMSGRHK